MARAALGPARIAAGARRPGARPRAAPGRSADSPFANPRVRLLLGVVVAVVVVAIIVLLVRDYERNRSVDGYTSYVTDPARSHRPRRRWARSSSTRCRTQRAIDGPAAGRPRRAGGPEPGTRPTRPRGSTYPPGVADANRALVLALQYRQDAVCSALATNLQHDRAHRVSDSAAAESVASSMQQFLASDVIVQDSYLAETAQALRNESITGVSVPSASSVIFLQGANQQYVLASWCGPAAEPRCAMSGTESSGQGAPVGLSLVSVVGEPSSITLTPGIAETIPESSNLHWAVTVHNGGSYVENNIKVTASLSYGTSPVDVQTNTISTINPGQQILLSVPGPQASAVKLGTLGLLHVAGCDRPRRAEHRQQRRGLPDHGHLQLRSPR